MSTFHPAFSHRCDPGGSRDGCACQLRHGLWCLYTASFASDVDGPVFILLQNCDSATL
jgi:hypothetical protein